MTNQDGDLETRIVKDDEVLNEWASYPDRFFDILFSSPEMVRDFVEHRDLYVIKKVHPVYLEDPLRPIPGMKLRDSYNARFIMINGKILKNRWGRHD
jgi:hypothetical protein